MLIPCVFSERKPDINWVLICKRFFIDLQVKMFGKVNTSRQHQNQHIVTNLCLDIFVVHNMHFETIEGVVESTQTHKVK